MRSFKNTSFHNEKFSHIYLLSSHFFLLWAINSSWRNNSSISCNNNKHSTEKERRGSIKRSLWEMEGRRTVDRRERKNNFHPCCATRLLDICCFYVLHSSGRFKDFFAILYINILVNKTIKLKQCNRFARTAADFLNKFSFRTYCWLYKFYL